jgi:catechol 2,3-dioxygenase
MHSATAPVEIGRVSLVVNDLPRVADFYARVLGLAQLSADGAEATLGAGDRALVHLRADAAAPRPSAREAGLFHTAFLLPSRAALAEWLVHAAGAGVRLQGASDHLVSEAIYLADPEGNGIEVYADRPRAQWQDAAGEVRMATERLDLDALAGAAGAAWRGAPEGTVIGHVHLQVGALPEAEAFLAGRLGLAVRARYPGAVFTASGGYHHHLAANLCNSRGAGPRPQGAAGLAGVDLLADAGLPGLAPGDVLHDPWGTAFRILPRAA